MASSECRSCGAVMRWAVTENGRHQPIDPEPTPAGNLVIVAERYGTPVVRPAQLGDDPDGERYMPHHATCPDGASWKRPTSRRTQ